MEGSTPAQSFENAFERDLCRDPNCAVVPEKQLFICRGPANLRSESFNKKDTNI